MNDNSIMPLGKHKGKKLEDVPQGWFIWMHDHNKLKGELKKYAEENINILRFQKHQQQKKKICKLLF